MLNICREHTEPSLKSTNNLMSRSNPYKKKIREAKRTLLLYCEGADEKAFLNYLKTLFSKNSGVHTEIKENYGGSANDVLTNVMKQNRADVVACVYDSDSGVDSELRGRVQKMGILCVENTPCLESFLLEILEGKDYSRHKNCDCKKMFEKKYLDEKRRKDKRNYEKVFPKKLLTKQVGKVENLRILIDLISGK